METRETGNAKTLLVVSNDQDFQHKVLAVIHQSGFDSKLSVNPCSYTHYPSNTSAEMALFDLSHADTSLVEFIQKFCVMHPNIKIICAGSNLNVDQVLYLIKIGVHHFLKLPFDPQEFTTLLNTVFSEKSQGADPGGEPVKKGRVITVYSLKGGSGVSMLTINLAIAHVKQTKNARVAVCDLGSQTGDVSTYLNLNPKYTIRDIIDNISRLDRSLFDGVLTPHESGLHVLSSPTLDQEPLSSYCLQEWETILSMMKQTHDTIFIDSAHTDEALLQHTLLQSDLILLIGNLDVPSLKGLLLGISKLARLRVEPERIKIVINRYNAKNQLDIKEFVQNAKHQVACKLPNQYNICIESVNTGKPLNLFYESSDVAKKIAEFSEQIKTELLHIGQFKTTAVTSEKSAGTPPHTKKGLWGFLL